MQEHELSLNHHLVIKEKLINILRDEKNFITNASNFASLIYHNLNGVNWAGFYFISNENLVLGPYQGKIACTRIPISDGVCGSCIRTRKPIIVPDVHKFPGYIPCDPSANSEMVLPVIYRNKIIGVFDLDSSIYNRFNEIEAEFISSLLEILMNCSSVDSIITYYELHN